MFVWFAAVSVTVVALVFGSPDLDYRLVMLGSVLPLAEGVFGGRWLLHSVVFNAVLLLGVMVVARGRRPTQRRWLALPIGTFWIGLAIKDGQDRAIEVLLPGDRDQCKQGAAKAALDLLGEELGS